MRSLLETTPRKLSVEAALFPSGRCPSTKLAWRRLISASTHGHDGPMKISVNVLSFPQEHVG
jgi:hypothetical protein